MAKDVIITPASGNIQFKDSNSVVRSTIYLDDVTNALVFGNTAANVYVGDGVTSVDLIFEQSGAVRAVTGKTLTIGQVDSFLTVRSPTTISSTASIAGNITAGDSLNFTNASPEITFTAANPWINAPSYINVPGGAYFNNQSVYTEASLKARGGLVNDTGTKILTVVNTSQLSVANTTATTSTSTGALLVSGGVGVAGGISAGSNMVLNNNLYYQIRNSSGAATSVLGMDSSNTIRLYSTGGTLHISPDTTQTTYLHFNNGGSVIVGDGTTTTNFQVTKGNVTASNVVITTGIFYSNGAAYSSGSSGTTVSGAVNTLIQQNFGGF